MHHNFKEKKRKIKQKYVIINDYVVSKEKYTFNYLPTIVLIQKSSEKMNEQ